VAASISLGQHPRARRRLCNGARFVGPLCTAALDHRTAAACCETHTHTLNHPDECDGHSSSASSGSRTSFTPAPEHAPPTVCASWTELASPTCASPVRLGCSFTPQTPLTAAVIAADGLYKRDVFRRCSRPPVCHPGAHSAQASRTPSPWPRSMASRRAPRASSRRR
jgi:hypothetical protein